MVESWPTTQPSQVEDGCVAVAEIGQKLSLPIYLPVKRCEWWLAYAVANPSLPFVSGSSMAECLCDGVVSATTMADTTRIILSYSMPAVYAR